VSQLISVHVGEVVWVRSQGNPPWPAIIISSEEADDFSIPKGNVRSPQVRGTAASRAPLNNARQHSPTTGPCSSRTGGVHCCLDCSTATQLGWHHCY
jgi:hypothetical protein